MPAKLSEITARVKGEIDWVKDEEIYYLVLNQGNDLTFTIETLTLLRKKLTEIENDQEEGEPACLVTISTSPKKWSTGMD